jgi:hypothetical protein
LENDGTGSRNRLRSLASEMRKTSDMPAAAILLSTYNGARFLPAFLDSLDCQSFSSVAVYWRDDGSIDASEEIVGNAKLRFPVTRIAANARLGPAGSFLTLLEAAAGRHASYHFADQDDIWLQDRVRIAHEAVTMRTVPALYHAPAQPVSSVGTPIGRPIPASVASFEHALVENCVIGCTSAINAQTAQLMIKGAPRGVLMHDWWAYLITTGFGEVIAGADVQVLYRQHGSNVVGANLGLRRITGRFQRAWRRGKSLPTVTDQLLEFLRIHGRVLRPDRRIALESMVACRNSISGRLRVALSPPFRRTSSLDQTLFRVAALLGKI